MIDADDHDVAFEAAFSAFLSAMDPKGEHRFCGRECAALQAGIKAYTDSLQEFVLPRRLPPRPWL